MPHSFLEKHNIDRYHIEELVPYLVAHYLCVHYHYNFIYLLTSLITSSPTLWTPSTIIIIPHEYHYSRFLCHGV